MKKMVIRINLTLLPVFFLLVLEYKLFYLFKLPGTYGATGNTIPVFMFSLILFILFFTRDNVNNGYAFSHYMGYVFLLFAIEMLYTIICYPTESLLELFKQILPMLTLLSYFYLAYSLKNFYDETIKLIVWTSTVGALILILQAYLFNNFHVNLFHIYGFNYGSEIYFRNGSVRLIGSSLVDFTAYLCIALLFSPFGKHNKGLLVSNLLVVGIYNFTVSQTRSTFVWLLVMIFLFFLMYENKNILVKLSMILIAMVVGWYVFSEVKQMFSNWQNDWSIYHRVESIKFYISSFGKHLIFGVGFLPDQPLDSSNYRLVHGNSKWAYGYSDVGVFGDLARFGIVCVMIYLPIISKCLKNIKINNKINTVVVGILFSIIFSMINLSMLNAQRVLVLALYLAFIDVSSEKMAFDN